MAGNLRELKAETQYHTLGDVRAQVLVETMVDTFEVAKSKRLGNTLLNI